MIKVGRFDGKGIAGSEQWGTAGDNDTPQIGVDLNCKMPDGSFEQVTVFLSFSAKASPYSFKKLEAMGWKGKGAADLGDLTGIDANIVTVNVTEEIWQGKPQIKADVMTGPGRAVMQKPMDKADFARRVSVLISTNAGGVAGGGDPMPPGFVPGPDGKPMKPPF